MFSLSVSDKRRACFDNLIIAAKSRLPDDRHSLDHLRPAQHRHQLEDQLASANLALQQRQRHRKSHLILSSQVLLLRGEDGEEHPLEVPLWTQHRGASSTLLSAVPVSSAPRQTK